MMFLCIACRIHYFAFAVFFLIGYWDRRLVQLDSMVMTIAIQAGRRVDIIKVKRMETCIHACQGCMLFNVTR